MDRSGPAKEVAVPCGRLLQYAPLFRAQWKVGRKVETHRRSGDGAFHPRRQLTVHQRNPDRGLSMARNDAGGIEDPAGILVAAVDFVE